MLFSTTNLFKSISCPEGANCRLTSCIYAHEPVQSSSAAPAQEPSVKSDAVEPAAKRRKITYDTLADKPPSKADLIRSQLAAARPDAQSSASSSRSSTQPRSLVKPVSPPQTKAKPVPPLQTAGKAAGPPATGSGTAANKHDSTKTKTLAPPEPLNPRLIPKDPAGHAKRSLFIKHLHAEMVRLNQKVHELNVEDLLHLSEQELVKLVLDEEEKIARDSPNVYPVIIKHRISALKKISPQDWSKQIKETRELNSTGQQKRKSDEEKVISTGLPLDEEHLIIPHLVVPDQSALIPFGYIVTPPTDAETASAADGVIASKNYEICDRCAARFQVFPDRNPETGLLTGGGACNFHPNRPIQPPRAKGESPKTKTYPCCNEALGSPGCTRNEEHVFKTTSPARLAAVCPFITTPEHSDPIIAPKSGKEVKAVVFDCEMGYTSLGLELIRLTALSWPEAEELVDVLVRPLGAIIDLNSRFSGVFPADYDKPGAVEGPQEARSLLCRFLTPETPLMGHAIDNDLNTVRLCHPKIVDTVLLFPHPRGLPMRFGLRMLSQRHLGRAIQGGNGHDSGEDARATGDLVRCKVAEKWKAMRVEGWKIEAGKLVQPEGYVGPAEVKAGDKRKLGERDSGDENGGHAADEGKKAEVAV